MAIGQLFNSLCAIWWLSLASWRQWTAWILRVIVAFALGPLYVLTFGQ
jgi:hypothetical protein